MWQASRKIRKAKGRVDDKNRLCEDIKDLVGLGDHIIKKRNCKLNTDLMYRVFRRDANLYAAKQARRIKFYELARELPGMQGTHHVLHSRLPGKTSCL